MDASQHQHAETIVEVSATDALTRKLLTTNDTRLVPAPNVGIAWTSHTEFAKFRGLYVVQSPTEARHVRYAMDIACDDLHLHMRCIQRFNNFYLLRKRLLLSLKSYHALVPRSTLYEAPHESILNVKKQACCAACRQVRQSLKRVPFPKRSLLFTTADDVDARVPRLELFLDECVKMLADWPGCERGRRRATIILGKFLSVDLLGRLVEQAKLATERDQYNSGNQQDADSTGSARVVVPQDSRKETSTGNANQVEAM